MGEQPDIGSRPASARPAKKKVRGTVFINTARCKGCGFCIAFCPPHVLAFSQEFGPQGYHLPYLAHPAHCTGCDLCGLYCPDFAIYSVIIKDEAAVTDSADGTTEETEP